MSNSLEQIALRVAKECYVAVETADGTHLELEPINYTNRLVAALGAQEPVATFAHKRGIPEGTSEFWGYLWKPQIIIGQGTKLYAAPQLPQREGWQPIETAPKDGAKVLLARCGKNEAGTDLGVWWACKGFWSSRWNNWNDGVEPCGLAHPTHWMPLPKAPNVELTGVPPTDHTKEQ